MKKHSTLFSIIGLFVAILISYGYARNAQAALVVCGRGQSMCTLCDIIVGINSLIRWAFGISFIIALAMITFGAVMYIVSAGNPGDMQKAKAWMVNAGVGMALMFMAGFMVTVTMNIIGAKKDLGISKVSGWNKFECNRREPGIQPITFNQSTNIQSTKK